MPEHAIRDDPAEHRREIDEAGVHAINVGGERLNIERPKQRFKDVFEGGQPDDLAGGIRQKHVFDHVEHEQRPHSVVGEAFPHLGCEQETEPPRMAEKIGLRG